MTQPREGETRPESYKLELCGLSRYLPLVEIEKDIWVYSFVMLGDTELVETTAGALAKRLAGYEPDYLVSVEVKAIPLVQVLSALLSRLHCRPIPYIVCRKSIKGYMKDYLLVEGTKSITTREQQMLVLDGPDVAKIRGKKVIVIDDVVSTGGTLESVKTLLHQAGAEIIAIAAVLQEGRTYQGEGLIYLAYLPLPNEQE
ncbi:MAG: adenine phosphoribosyltransferase [Chloroflexi bacterium]|nr:adenine phosphoribosyltransferase [Chloroflexota bacterium]MCL5075307.1 adenine phosphoribosyltransferase [Chloroflexota bacterium]